MTPNPVVVSPDTTLGEFMDNVARSRRHTTYPVVDEGKPVGLLPFRSVSNVPRSEWDVRRVRDCLISLDKVPVLREGEDAVDALAELSESSGGHGLVVSNGGLAGMSRRAISRARSRQGGAAAARPRVAGREYRLQAKTFEQSSIPIGVK